MGFLNFIIFLGVKTFIERDLKLKRVVLVTGGFDPLHSGHLAYFKHAKKLGDLLVVGVNSDSWLSRKKGRAFMSFNERCEIIMELECVDDVIGFNDEDNTARQAIEHILKMENGESRVVFANGGDRKTATTPEYKRFSNHPNVEFVFGVGGKDKKNSSSWILKNWKQPIVERNWGRYRILESGLGWQVKKLNFNVNQSLSDRRHFNRSEHWHIVEGLIKIEMERDSGDHFVWRGNAGASIDIPPATWHRAANIGTKPAIVIEVWLGNELSEDDIERRKN